ncbi:AraC family transcriptional regulator ligand-binding domain-containing protein [Haliangium sp.]|uniref:AraC family transcriptional regulator n=1 Tax=Haliangium sp. TaxID=2663208 RepID=UPI003D14A602
MSTPRRIDAKTIWLQVRTSLAHGLAADELDAMGLREQALLAPDAMVPAELVYEHLAQVERRSDIEAFVIDLARAHSISSMGVLGFAIKSAPTARAALTRLRRYQHLTNTLAAFDVIEHDAGATFVEQRFGPVTRGHLLATEVSLLTTIHMWRGLIAPALSPRMVYLRRDDVRVGAYEAFCGCPVATGAERGRFDFDPAWLDRPLASADPDMAAYFDHTLAQLERAARARPTVITEVRRTLARMLPEGPPSVATVAASLGLSARTLQRRLRAEGSSFANVLEQVRADLAPAYLDNPALSASEIAYLLGYAEAGSFSRAFRRWHGCPPDHYRRRRG